MKKDNEFLWHGFVNFVGLVFLFFMADSIYDLVNLISKSDFFVGWRLGVVYYCLLLGRIQLISTPLVAAVFAFALNSNKFRDWIFGKGK